MHHAEKHLVKINHGVESVGLTLPQALQWCRLSVRLKSVVQFMHIITWETGTRTGAASPRAIHSFSRACGRIRDRTAFRTAWRYDEYDWFKALFQNKPLTSLQGPPNVQSPAAWSAMARLSVWNQSSLSPTELETEHKTNHYIWFLCALMIQHSRQLYCLMPTVTERFFKFNFRVFPLTWLTV